MLAAGNAEGAYLQLVRYDISYKRLSKLLESFAILDIFPF